MNSVVSLRQTKLFLAYDVSDESDEEEKPTKQRLRRSHYTATTQTLDDLRLSPQFITKSTFQRLFVRNLSRYGCAVLVNTIPLEALSKARKRVKALVNKCFIPYYDEVADEFCELDQNLLNITRMPRIGRGKHNIHFDPEFSEEHKVLSELIDSSGVLNLLSAYMGGSCILRETGISITRPSSHHTNQPQTEETSAVELTSKYGEGMEWHSDGAKGEATMLLGLDDMPQDQGVLRMLPGSHRQYVDGVGHDEKLIKTNQKELERDMVEYAYKAGEPILFDARTLHSVAFNKSPDWRLVCWFIIDCY